MNVRVREATPADAAGIVAVFNPIIESGLYTAFDTPFSVDAERRYLDTLPARAVFLVALDASGVIVGFQSMEPFATFTGAFSHVGVIGTYVDLARRRQGIARALFAASFAAARAKGYRKIFTYVRADNPVALATYLAQGFRIVGTAERHTFIRGRYVDEVIIEKMLAIEDLGT